MSYSRRPRPGARLARELNDKGDVVPGMVNVAHTVPVNAWGGHEKGWSVSLVPTA